jgi:hypothetical protein
MRLDKTVEFLTEKDKAWLKAALLVYELDDGQIREGAERYDWLPCNQTLSEEMLAFYRYVDALELEAKARERGDAKAIARDAWREGLFYRYLGPRASAAESE